MMDCARYPLTEAQQGLWFAQRVAPNDPAFNTAHVVWLTGPLDVLAFTHAANQAVTEAEALSLRFANTEDGPCQWQDAHAIPLLDVVDLRGQQQANATAQSLMRADYLTPLDPTRDRLAKQQLFLFDNDQFAWYLRVHHLVNDGYGMALLADRTCALYGGEHTRREFAPLQPVWAEDAEYQDSARRTKDAAYWQKTLADLPPPASITGEQANQATTATSHQQGTQAASACHRIIVSLEQSVLDGLHELAGAQQVPWPDVLSALCAEYCRRHSDNAPAAVVGVPYMGRLGSASARTPAMVMNVLPLVVAASPNITGHPSEPAESSCLLSDFLQHTARELTRGRRHGRYRGEQLRRDLGLVGGQRRLYGPLINVQPFYSPLVWPNLASQLDILSTGPVEDLTFGFRGDANAQLDLEIEANSQLYRLSEVEAHAARLPAFLRSAYAVYHAGGRLQDIPLATPAEAERYLYQVNATAHPVVPTSLVSLYEATMKATPEATALVFDGQTLSYAELEVRTRALALQLQKRGVTANSLVAVGLARSMELVIALVAIQRAGGAYLPLDLAQPDARLARIVELAKPVCVLTEATQRFPLTPVLAPHQWQLDSEQPLTHQVSPADAAYVIYTSGSTGDPKGVVVEHKAIVNRLLWMQDYFAIDSSERILQKTPATFDVSVWEFFLPLLAGAQLVIAPPEAHHDPRHIAELVREQHITTLHFVPSMLAALLATPHLSGFTPRRVIVSGEALTASLRDQFHQKLDCQLFNLYGPTEAAVDVSVWPACAEDASVAVPIGVPVWNTQLYVLDSQLRPQPPGVAGDLYLGGVQLARGYLGQPALTAASFIDHPFIAGERLYKSGDVARFRDDGAVEYLGRSDDQVKLRGLRIELGDINHALSLATGVASAEVVLRHINGGAGVSEPRLVAYVQPHATAAPSAVDAQTLRAHLSNCLPEYMIPSAFVTIEHWPLSANGKLDRKLLPEPELASTAGGELTTATERDLALLFAEQLQLTQPIGANDDFFALGGDSLSAVHLLLAIQARWQWDPGFGALFATPTVGGLAALIDAPEGRADDGLRPYVQLAEGPSDRAPLFTIHPAGGIAWNYRELAQALSPSRAVYGLQSPALQAERSLEQSITELAALYVDTLTQLYPQGPVHLVGWSVGGIIAHEMAVCLRKQGRAVGVLALLDAYPAECWRAEPEPSPVAALRALLAIAGYDPELHPELDSREKIVAFLRQGDSTLGNLPNAALDGVVRAVTSTNQLVRGHYHGYFDGCLMHLRAERDHANKPQLQSRLWVDYAEQLDAVALPFLHAEMTGRDASARIAPLLATRMAEYESDLATAHIQETPCN
ncbi:MAG: amino acid adenylation domain-containing protein [Oceanisphaera sp.]